MFLLDSDGDALKSQPQLAPPRPRGASRPEREIASPLKSSKDTCSYSIRMETL